MTPGDLSTAAAAITAIDTLLYDIEDEVNDVVARLREDTLSRASVHEAAVDESSSRLTTEVTAHLDDADGPLAPVLDVVTRLDEHVNLAVGDDAHAVSGVADRAVSHIDQALTNALPSLGEVFAGLTRVFGRLIDGLLGSLTDTDTLWQSLIEAVHRGLTGTETGQAGWVYLVVKQALARSLEDTTISDAVTLPESGVVDRVTPAGGQTVEQFVAQTRDMPRIFVALLNLGSFAGSAITLANARMAGVISGMAQSALYESLTTPLSVSQLLGLVKQRVIGEEFAKNHARRSGLSNELFDLLRRGDRAYLSVAEMQDMWRRTGNDRELDNLVNLGFTQEDIAAIQALALAEATPSDVVRFLVRDAFDESAVNRGGLDEDFDRKYDADAFRKAGVTEQLARYYWRAHWQLPSPTQGYNMLHRGLMTLDQLRELLKQADYAPGYVQNLIDIAYLVPGRIDVRRMYESGILTTHEELVHYHKLMGYSPEHAEVLAGFVERLKEQSDEAKRERRFGRLANEIVRSFVVGHLSEVQARTALGQLGYTAAAIDGRVAEGIYARQRDRADTIRDALRKDYVRGFKTREQTVERLTAYAFDGDEIAYLLDGWDLERELREETDAEREQKDLTKAELLEAYTDGLLSRDDVAQRIVALGYDNAETATLLDLHDARQIRAENKLAEQAIRTAYLRRRREEADARAALEALGYTERRVSALMERWSIEREESRPDISPAQLERMLMQGVLAEDDIAERLRQRGYVEADVSALLTLYGTDVSIAADKLAEQRRQFEIREQRLSEQGGRRLDLTERGQTLADRRAAEQRNDVQQRFDATQSERARLQRERLEAQAAQQTERLAAATLRDSEAAIAARTRQAAALQAQSDRLDKQLAAASERQAAAIAAAQEARAQQARLAADARAAQDTREQRRLEALAERQNRAIDAAERRAADADQARRALQAQRQQYATETLGLQDELRRLGEIRAESRRIGQEQRDEQRRIRQETRTQARRDIASAGAAANAAALQGVQLRRAAAIAEVSARFAALQAEVADQRRVDSLNAKLLAEEALARSIPTSTLLDTTI